jgi:ribonuclease HI
MKQLRLKQRYCQEISRGELSALLIAEDNQNITVNDEVEFINDDSHEAIGTLHINEVTIKRLSDFDNKQRVLTPLVSEQELDPNVVAKRLSFTFKPFHKKHQVADTDVNLYTNLTDVKLFADGGSRGNPGPSASGWVLYDMQDNLIKQNGFYLGITTNNQAEYQALRLGLEDAHKLRARRVEVYLDSLLVVNQMKGIFKVKNRDLWPIHHAIKELIHNAFQEVTFTHVPRELNKVADRMVNETLDAATN